MAFANSFLIIILCIMYLLEAKINQYEMINASFWRSTSIFKPIAATQYGTIQLLHSLRMEFTLVFYGRTDYENWQNIFRIGYRSTNNSCYGYGSRYPSLWLSPEQDQLTLSISQMGNCHYGAWKTYPIQKNVTYFMIIQFNDTWVYMEINNEIHINERRQSQTLSNIYNQYLHIWISTDKTIPQTEDIDMTLSNITIKTWNTNDTNVPSNNPTTFPTLNPSNQPTEAPTYSPTIEPTNKPSASPILYPTQTIIYTTGTEAILSSIAYTDNNTVGSRNMAQITEQNILFLLVGVLLSSIVCLCVMGVLLLYFCCQQMRRNPQVKYHRGRTSSLHKVNNVTYDSDNSTPTMRRHTSLDVGFGTDTGKRDSCSNSQSEMEGVLEETILDMEGYGMLDEEIVAAVNSNNRQRYEEKQFVGMLNNANVVNDIIMDDVIADMVTSRNAEKSCDSDTADTKDTDCS